MGNQSPDPRDAVAGFLYLIHFNRPIGDTSRPHMSAQHYLGWTEDEDYTKRLARHENGKGAAIMRYVSHLGIGYQLVWVRPGNRNDERRFKRSGHFRERLCTICIGDQLPKGQGR